jgi:hypothetical protein
MLAGFTVESIGNMVGFIAGTGNASRKIAAYEFHRIDKVHQQGDIHGHYKPFLSSVQQQDVSLPGKTQEHK